MTQMVNIIISIFTKIHKRKKRISEYYNYGKSLRTSDGKSVLIIGIPKYINLGDSAIAIAQKYMINNAGYSYNQIKEITLDDYYKYNFVIKHFINKKTLITCIGGGNMGDEWFVEEELRRRVLCDFPKNRVIVFPQTIYYTETEKGRFEQKNSVRFYNRTSCCLIAREQKSFEIMKDLYPKAKVLLTPDIVLSTKMKDYGVREQVRSGILWCMRSDAERNMSDEMRNGLEEFVSKYNEDIIKTDMYADVPVITKDNRMEQVKLKMEQFASSKLVITDRLHGMLFAAITETPCIIFDNYNHKVIGTYEWIKELPYIKHVKTVDEAKKYIPELLQISNCRFDNSSLFQCYDRILEKLK